MTDDPRRPDWERLVPARDVTAERTAAGRVSAADDAEADVVARGAMRRQRLDEWHRTVPWRFRDARVDDFTGRPVHDDLVAWAQTTEPTNLVVVGPVGVGKSHAATAAVRNLFGAGETLHWVPVGEMLDRLDWRRPDSHAYMDLLMAVDLLVVDDLGTDRANEWTGERLYGVVNRRHLDGLRTVATSNLEPDDLAEHLGERTYSRLAGTAYVIRLAGHDRRRADA